MKGQAVRLFFLATMVAVYIHAISDPFGTRLAYASGTFLPRDRAIWTAEDYRSHEWYADSSNATRYQGVGLHVGVPYWIDATAGHSVAQFQVNLGLGYRAGDDPDHPSDSKTGLDCSGYVSRVWELGGKYGTWYLRYDQGEITRQSPNGRFNMGRADAFVWYSTYSSDGYGHTGVFYKYQSGYPWVYEETADGARTVRLYYDSDGSRFLYALDPYNPNQYKYEPREYLSITSDLHTYVPYIRVDGNTHVWIRITSISGSGSGSVTFLNSSGSTLQTHYFSVNAGGTAVVHANDYVNNGIYVAQVTSNIPVAVTAELNSTPSGYETDAYAGVTNGSDKIFVPLVMYNWGVSNKYTDFNIMNIGRNSVTVNLNYYKSGGNGNAPNQTSYTISPQGFVSIDTRTQSGWSGNVYGTAVVSAGDATRQIVVTARQRRDADKATVLFNGINSEEARVAVREPLIMNNNVGWNSGLQVQNAGGRITTVTVNYYQADGGWVKSSTAAIAPNYAATFYAPSEGLPNPFVGSAVVDSYGSNDQPIVAIINAENSYNNRTMAHEGGNIGAYTAFAPAVLSQPDYAYATGIQVQNIDSAQATVYVDYYYQNGSWASQVGPFYLNPNISHTIYPAGPGGFDGSAKVWSSNSKRLVTITNLTVLSGWTGDRDKSYTLPIPRVDEIGP